MQLILGIIGAMAWLPIIIAPLVNAHRKIRASLLECRIQTNGISISAITEEKKAGILALLVVNIFRKNTDYYPTSIRAVFQLKDGRKYNAEILDFSTITLNNKDGESCFSIFSIPVDMEFNVSRTIKGNADNIKAIAFLVEGATFESLSQVQEIRINLRSGRLNRRTIKIVAPDFPRFNSTRILGRFEERLRVQNEV